MKAVKAPSGEPANGADSLRQRAYVILRSLIEVGQIKPGERLLEAQIANAFGISRSPARQALEDLHNAGFITKSSVRGYRVNGDADERHEGKLAKLNDVRVVVPRNWERMYAELEKAISIQMLFGSVSVNDQRLADYFGVSRTVTRDALARMAGSGLISKDRSGHWIADHMTADHIRDLFEVRWILEPQALLKAAPFISEQELIAARHNVQRALAKSPIESADFDRTELDVHTRFLSHCPNKEILTALDRTHTLFAPTRHLSDPFLGIPMELIDVAVREHLVILDSLDAGKSEKAAEQLADHIRAALSRWLVRLSISSRLHQVDCPPYLTRVHP